MNHKWYAFELNSKFDNLSNLIEKKSLSNCITYFAISHFISLSEAYFHVKACLLFMNKLRIKIQI